MAGEIAGFCSYSVVMPLRGFYRLANIQTNNQVSLDLIPEIRKAYNTEIKRTMQDDKFQELHKLKAHLSDLQGEEARLARLFMTEKINEETYDQLRQEWQDKVRKLERTIKDLKLILVNIQMIWRWP